MINKAAAEITASGLVQGVGFRYYILKHAQVLGLTGYTKNLYTGEVYTAAEGEKAKIEELFKLIRTGPSHSDVRSCKIIWREPENRYSFFEIRH